MRSSVITVAILLLLIPRAHYAQSPLAGNAADSSSNYAQIEFFEQHIRPALIEHCYECHSASENAMEGGLALDAAVGWQTGGDTGPAIVPGDPDRSLLLSALRYEGLEMPPKGRLPDGLIERFRQWIELGATDPRIEPLQERPASKIDIRTGRQFWSFQSPQLYPTPAVEHKTWAQTEIDSFLLARMEAAGVTPNAVADPATRLRRLSLDLTGLPPPIDLIESFLADSSQTHWEQIVDRMLASKSYGEYWGRHWLDVARYADSNGSDFNATYPSAWRYRNWVIESMNNDLPFDQFVRMQIAGDLMTASDDLALTDHLVATSFLMIGPKMLSERNKDKLRMDIVDEQIDAIGKVFMGLTLGCARCHDHKFDPIPTEDYYALAGILRSTRNVEGEIQKYVSDWTETPLPAAPEIVAAFESHRNESKRLEAEVQKAKKQLDTAKDKSKRWNGIVLDDVDAVRVGYWKESVSVPTFVGEGYLHDDNRNKGDASITFRTTLPESGKYRIRFSYTASPSRASAVPVELKYGERREQFTIDQRTAPEQSQWRTVGTVELPANEPLEIMISNRGTDGYVIVDAIQLLPEDAPVTSKAKDGDADDSELVQLVKKAELALKEHQGAAPPKLPMAMAAHDLPAKKIEDACLCVRGEVENQGPKIPRGFLQVCSSSKIPIASEQSGRRELAEWLTDPDHPLLARVIVNRVWMNLTGEGLVRTVDNFGLHGDRPSHPELLDTLAVRFVRGGWSIRRLVREIVTSRFYQASSEQDADALKIDSENRLLWRSHRRRVSAESMRDTLLVASELLDPTVGVETMAGFGELVDKNVADSSLVIAASRRRTVYEPVVRNYLPPLMAAFDFADPDMIVGQRTVTNVPAQTLVLLNHPEVVDFVRSIAASVAAKHHDTPRRIEEIYLRLLARQPMPEEFSEALAYIAGDKSTRSIEALVHAIVASTQFRFMD